MTIPPLSPEPDLPSSSSVSSQTLSQIPFETKVEALAPELFSLPQIQIHSFLAILSNIGEWFDSKARFERISDESVDQCESLIEQKKYTEAPKKVSDLISEFFKIRADKIFYHEKNVNFLNKKISDIVINSEMDPKSKKEILRNLFQDFINAFQEAEERVKKDISQGRLTSLGVSSDDHLVSLQSLGAETHHCGKIPLLLEFKSGKQIVYKPRSMLAEKLICSKDEGLFAKVGLGAYGVVDTGENYGYCEYLQNTQSENTLNSLKQVQDYFLQLAKLDQICQILKVSDLHHENFITSSKVAYLIDAESFANPEGTETGMYEEWGAANTFYQNSIWLNPSLNVGMDKFKDIMEKDDLKALGVDLKRLQPPPLSSEILIEASSVYQKLSKNLGRFVLIDTQILKGILFRADPRNPAHLQHFIDEVKLNISQLGFQYLEDQNANILLKYQSNVLHNDVPVFYYDSTHQTLLYEGIVIARR